MKFMKVLLILCAICFTGCGSSSPRPPQGPSLLTGNWQLELAKTATATAKKNQSGFFQENASVVTGNLQMYTGDGACPGVGTVTGSQTGQNVSLTIDSQGQAETLTGTVDATGSTMSGTYAILASGCGQSETGVWSAASVKPFSGNFTANMTANADGSQWIINGSISQGASGGNVTAPVSGSMTSSDPTSTPSCFSSATFTGNVSGTSLIWNLADPTGIQLGQVMLTYDSTSGGAAGKYVINKQTGTLPPGAVCRSGEGGVVTATFP